MTDKPEHPEGQASEQDQSLEAQLNALLDDLEATEPQMVPKDLRKQKPQTPAPEPVAAKPAESAPTPPPAEPLPQPQPVVNEEPQPQPAAEVETDCGPVSDAELEALVAQAAEAEPKPAKKGLDLDEIASMASNLLDKQIEDTIAAAKQNQTQAPPAEPPGAPGAPAKKGLDLESIASMASNLLDKQIADMVAETARPGQATPAVDAASASPETPAPAPGPGTEETSETLGEDELGAHIQALLNHVQAQPDFGESASDETPAAPASAVDPPTRTPAARPASAELAPEPAPDNDEAASSYAGAVSIDEIDAMLAASAARAIEQEPEPAAEVPGTDEILAAQALEDDASRQAEAQPAIQPRAGHEEPDPAPAPTPTPQPAPAAPRPIGATAADVADELDEDDMPAPAPAKAEQPAHDDALEPAAVVIKRSALKETEKTLLRLCGKVNRPLNRLSPEMKDTVGYVGIVVLLPALCLILYGLVF